MNKITVSALVKGPIEKVWTCYTSPEHIVHWNFADETWHCPRATNDLRVGGKLVARMEAKDGSEGFDFEVEYTEVVPQKKLSYAFDDRIAEITFDAADQSTRVIISFDPENENPVDLQRAGWQSILDHFKSYCETK